MSAENTVIDLSTGDVAIAAGLVLISGGISLALKLNMEKSWPLLPSGQWPSFFSSVSFSRRSLR